MRARRDLVAHRVAACNQLRAHLAVAFPAAVGLFYELDSPISLAFLARFGSHDAIAQGQKPPHRGRTRPPCRMPGTTVLYGTAAWGLPAGALGETQMGERVTK